MRICLVNPPEIPGHVSDRDKAGGIGVAKPRLATWRTPYLPPTPPMDWLYAAAIAERAGHDVSMIDAIAKRWGTADVVAAAKQHHPEHIGVRLSVPSLEADLAMANALVDALPNARVFVYGQTIRTTYKLWAAQCRAHVVMHGEVEALLPKYLRGEESPSMAPAVADDPACKPWAVIEDLEALPFPAWKHVDIPAYTRPGRPQDFVYYILTSRGCPKGCSMCPYYVHQGKAWRSRSVANVLAEFDMLRNLGARQVQTRDPNISWRKAHLHGIAEGLKGEKQMRIATETDLEALDERDLRMMLDAGFVRIMTGVESVDEAILKEIHQNGNALRRALANMKLCDQLGIEVTGFFVVGSLAETWQTVRNTVETARLLPCQYSVSLMTPYHGTVLREEFERAGFVRPPTSFRDYGGFQGLVRTHGLDHDEVILAHAWATAELELVARRRLVTEASGVGRLWARARVAKQLQRTWGLRGAVATREKNAPPVAAAAPTP